MNGRMIIPVPVGCIDGLINKRNAGLSLTVGRAVFFFLFFFPSFCDIGLIRLLFFSSFFF